MSTASWRRRRATTNRSSRRLPQRATSKRCGIWCAISPPRRTSSTTRCGLSARAGPRAGQALVLGAKSRALLDGRCVAAPEDVRAIALPVLRHRILLNFQAEADGIDADQIVARLLEAVQTP